VAEEINDITGYILAGGKSSRMGTDKGLLLFNGEPLVLRTIKQLRSVVTKVVIVSNNNEYQKFGLEVIEDLLKGIGPAGGIHAAFHNSLTSKLFVVSCDMPFITSQSIDYLLLHGTQSQITLPLYRGKIQPLFGVYSTSCLPGWKQLIDRGIVKLQEMVTHFDLSTLDVSHHELFSNLLFTNINNKTDFNKAVKKLNHGN